MLIRKAVLYWFVFSVPVAQAADLASRIDAVTVYPGGATVTRIASASLVAGSNEIRLTGLVNSINAETLQVEVMDDGVQVGQIKVGTEQQRDAYDAEVTAVQEQIDTLKSRIGAVDDSSAAAKLRLQFLEGIAQGYAKEAWFEGSRGTADVESWRAALELLQSGSEDANRLIRDNEVKKADFAKDLSVLERKLADLRGGSLATSVVELALDAERTTQADIRLRYFQHGAYWSPIYQARLDSDAKSLQLTQQAEVNQQTDEDWTNVQLVLSTSEPVGDLIAPELDSEFLDLYEPQPERAVLMQRAPQADAPAAVEEIMVTGGRIEKIGQFAVSYEVPGRTTISNDSDDAVTVDLSSDSFDAELVTQVVPRRSTQAYLAARFDYDKSLPLNGGRMAVFVDGVFAGNTQMPTALPKSEVVLPMGQDRRVEVKSETQGGQVGEEGIVSKRKTETTDYVFEVTNRRASPSYVEVMDLYPVARNEDIEVEVPRTATAVDQRNIDDEPGLVKWKKTLAPGETWRIRHQYTISYPSDSILSRQ
jgi:uncharacterized protein (TIGR02231 family)